MEYQWAKLRLEKVPGYPTIEGGIDLKNSRLPRFPIQTAILICAGRCSWIIILTRM